MWLAQVLNVYYYSGQVRRDFAGHLVVFTPQENMVTALMTQVAWTSPGPARICLDV